MDNNLRSPRPPRVFAWHYATRYCGTTLPDESYCGQMFNIQTDARSGYFVSASTYLKPSDKGGVIVPRCPKCGCVIDQGWADNALTAAPDTVYRGGA